MIEGGIPVMLEVRRHVDALRGEALNGAAADGRSRATPHRASDPDGPSQDPALLPRSPPRTARSRIWRAWRAPQRKAAGGGRAGLADLDPRELVFGRAGQTFVNAAFTHTRPGGNRFNGDERGAWYAGFEARTALAEVATTSPASSSDKLRFDNVTDYVELLADFFGPFHDLRGVDAAEPYLDPDPAISPAGQALARRLRAEAGSNGIVYPSVRRAGGTCLAAFRPGPRAEPARGRNLAPRVAGTPAPRDPSPADTRLTKVQPS